MLGLQVHYTSVPVSRGTTAPTSITRFEGVFQKKEGTKMKQYISSTVEKEVPTGKQVCGHMGLVCPLGCREELSGGVGVWECGTPSNFEGVLL